MSASDQQRHDALLKEHGFTLVRRNKHYVYEQPQSRGGRVYVTSATPSDFRVWKNRLKTLKHVISTPAKPMVVAISEFEREQAAQVIEGQQLPTAGIQGKGKHARRSRGTGYKYVEKEEMTEEELALSEEVRQRARENAAQAEARREQERKDRRARKLQKKEEKEVAYQKDTERIAPFVGVMKAFLEEADDHYLRTIDAYDRVVLNENDRMYPLSWIEQDMVNALDVAKNEIPDITPEELLERKTTGAAHWVKSREQYPLAKVSETVERTIRKAIHLSQLTNMFNNDHGTNLYKFQTLGRVYDFMFRLTNVLQGLHAFDFEPEEQDDDIYREIRDNTTVSYINDHFYMASKEGVTRVPISVELLQPMIYHFANRLVYTLEDPDPINEEWETYAVYDLTFNALMGFLERAHEDEVAEVETEKEVVAA